MIMRICRASKWPKKTWKPWLETASIIRKNDHSIASFKNNGSFSIRREDLFKKKQSNDSKIIACRPQKGMWSNKKNLNEFYLLLFLRAAYTIGNIHSWDTGLNLFLFCFYEFRLGKVRYCKRGFTCLDIFSCFKWFVICTLSNFLLTGSIGLCKTLGESFHGHWHALLPMVSTCIYTGWNCP